MLFLSGGNFSARNPPIESSKFTIPTLKFDFKKCPDNSPAIFSQVSG